MKQKNEMDSTQGRSGGNDECDATGETNFNDSGGSGNCEHSASNVNDSTASAEGLAIEEESTSRPKYMKRRMPRYYFTRPWNEVDAAKAAAVEMEVMKGLEKESLVIRFPDPELTKELIMSFHPGIEKVYFIAPIRPRYCFVQLAENVNAEEAVAELSKIDFGVGKLFVEKKHSKEKEEDSKPDTIDPYTLYIGNLPRNVNIISLKENFPGATRYDIGYAQRKKYTRYAFIRYSSVDDAIKAFKLNFDLLLESRSLTVRFRRIQGPIRPPKIIKKETKKERKKRLYGALKEEELYPEAIVTIPVPEQINVEYSAPTDLTVESVQVKGTENDSIKLHFPDPEVTTDIVKKYYPGIESVFFQVPCNPRFCILLLAENSNHDEIIKELSEVKFGIGKLFAERKIATKEEILESEALDPNIPSGSERAAAVGGMLLYDEPLQGYSRQSTEFST